MKNILKFILWIIVIVLIGFLVLGRNRDITDVPMAQDIEFGAGGERGESPNVAGSGGMDEFIDFEMMDGVTIESEI